MTGGGAAVAFAVEDFRDLVSLLEQHPEWRAELRRLVLTEELLELPAVMRQLAEAQTRTERELSDLRQAVAGLAEQVRGLVEQVRGLAAAQAQTAATVDVLVDQVGELRGDNLERRYRDHAGGYFGLMLRRVRVVDPDELDSILEEGVAAGALDEAGARDVRLADIIVRGRRPDEDRETYLVVEVSATVDLGDVVRAARRAALLGRVRPALAVVAGGGPGEEVAALARSSAVWRLEDGRVRSPDEP
jgi:hypothetical protein